jgi:hypothetical protein
MAKLRWLKGACAAIGVAAVAIGGAAGAAPRGAGTVHLLAGSGVVILVDGSESRWPMAHLTRSASDRA